MGYGSRMVSGPVFLFRQDTSSVNISTSYTQISAGIGSEVLMAQISNTSSTDMILAIGPAGSEVQLVYIPASSFAEIPMHLSKQTRIAVKSVSGTISSGVLIINLSY